MKLQNIHDSLVEYYEKEKIKKIKELEEIKKKVDISILIIQQKREIIVRKKDVKHYLYMYVCMYVCYKYGSIFFNLSLNTSKQTKHK